MSKLAILAIRANKYSMYDESANFIAFCKTKKEHCKIECSEQVWELITSCVSHSRATLAMFCYTSVGIGHDQWALFLPMF